MFAYEKQRTFNDCCRASSKNDKRLRQGLQKSAAQIETTLHVVDAIAVGLEGRLIAKLGRPDVGIVWMSHVPANSSFADAALQIRNVCGVLQSLQFSQLLLIRRIPESLACSSPYIQPGCVGRPFAESREDKESVQMRVLNDGIGGKVATDVIGAIDQTAIHTYAGVHVSSRPFAALQPRSITHWKGC